MLDDCAPFGTISAVQTLQERFWLKVFVGGPDDCWVWHGATGRNNYGHFRIGGRGGQHVRAHRLSYMWAHRLDTLPPDVYVCHRCDEPRCVNPAHLFTGTQLDNMTDCASKGRHQHGEQSGSAKLTTVQVHAIRQQLANGRRPSAIAVEFGVSPRCVSSIKLNERWRHV